MEQYVEKMEKIVEMIKCLIRPCITLSLTVLVFILALKGEITPQQILTLYGPIIGFWFGARGKKEDK